MGWNRPVAGGAGVGVRAQPTPTSPGAWSACRPRAGGDRAATATLPDAIRADLRTAAGHHRPGRQEKPGGGDNATVTYSTGGAGGGMTFHAQPGRASRFAGTHVDGPQVQYGSLADTNPGREA